MKESQHLDIIQQRAKESLIWYEFKNTLPRELKAISAIENDEARLMQLEKYYEIYAGYVTKWHGLFLIINDEFTNVKRTELYFDKGHEYYNEKRMELQKIINSFSNEIEDLRYKIKILNDANTTPATSSEPEPATKRKNPTIESDLKTAFEIIEPLKGYWNRKLILNENDFNRLKQYIESIIKNNSLPESAGEFPRTGTTNDFIRKTIYEVYRLTGKNNRQLFIDLVHLFRQFDNTEPATTASKFSTYTGNYNTDKETLITF